ncbi:MAG: signal peptidase I [Erythrobacter sp.]
MDVKTQSDTSGGDLSDSARAAAGDAAILDANHAKDEPQPETLGSFAMFLIKLVLAVLIFRSFIFSPFSIPSESMLPRLWNGDYLLAAKWPYGYSKFSMPYNAPIIPGRLFASPPEPGDVVIFKHPIDGSDYIKRVIALPGDSVGMVDGQLILNGEPVPKVAIDQIRIPVSPNTGCARQVFLQTNTAGEAVCTYDRFRETLPNGTTYEVLDFGPRDADNFDTVIVPEGRMFVMGDNRDNSQDSRFPAMAKGGVSMVPQENLVARATIIMWSTDGSASWVKPWTWFTAARWDRFGETL